MTSSEDEKAVVRWMLDQYQRQNRLVQLSAARGEPARHTPYLRRASRVQKSPAELGNQQGHP